MGELGCSLIIIVPVGVVLAFFMLATLSVAIKAKWKMDPKNWALLLMSWGVGVAFAVVFASAIGEYGAPEARLAREKQEAFEKEQAHAFVLAKDAAQTLNGRPLNTVEEKGVREFADRAAKERVDQAFASRDGGNGGNQPSQKPVEPKKTLEQEVKEVKGQVVSAAYVKLGGSKGYDQFSKSAMPDEVLRNAKGVMEALLKREKADREGWFKPGGTGAYFDKQNHYNAAERKQHREEIYRDLDADINAHKQLLERINVLIAGLPASPSAK